MTLDDLVSGLDRRVVQPVRQLAQSTADVRNDTAFTKLTTDDKSPMASRTADLFPEAKRFTGRDLDTVQFRYRDAQVVYFAGDQESFLRRRFSPKPRLGYRRHRSIRQSGSDGVAPHTRP